ncbi:MAG: Cas10/Cmr2 second palm domain-containing protein [Planctomycetaceae bacterium]
MTATSETSTPQATDNTAWSVRLDLKRVQTYLFEAPRLPVMVGANALMGETLRGFWQGDRFDDTIRSLPQLAQGTAAWPVGVAIGELTAPEAGNNFDPLKRGGVWQDDVAAVAEKTGVLTRDGGHFEAVFPTEPAATEFLKLAHDLIREQLPGVLVSGQVTKLSKIDGKWKSPKNGEPYQAESSASVFEFAQAEVCQYSGQEPASQIHQENDRDPETKRPVSDSVWQRIQRAKEFDSGSTRDVLGILRAELEQAVGVSGNRVFPSDFNELSVGGQIAIVHVDGNSVGTRFTNYIASCVDEDYFARWQAAEKFFRPLRVGMRRAVVKAVNSAFWGTSTDDGKKVPLRLLMLGGDDLVLVCGAPYALKFVVELARSVKEFTANMVDTQREPTLGAVTLGAGVAIVPDSFPFYRGHELAEQLTESAKRLKSALTQAKQDANVVDWMVTSEAWHGDIAETRCRDSFVNGSLLLSSKPYPILKPETAPGEKPTFKSLEEMLDDAQCLVALTRDNRVARSQLQGLVRQLPRGRQTARFAAEILPTSLKEVLRERRYLNKEDGPWRTLMRGETTANPSWYGTQLLDLLELFELQRMIAGERTSATEASCEESP